VRLQAIEHLVLNAAWGCACGTGIPAKRLAPIADIGTKRQAKVPKSSACEPDDEASTRRQQRILGAAN